MSMLACAVVMSHRWFKLRSIPVRATNERSRDGLGLRQKLLTLLRHVTHFDEAMTNWRNLSFNGLAERETVLMQLHESQKWKASVN
jgi:hypothetical protein